MFKGHLNRVPPHRPETTGLPILEVNQTVADRHGAPAISVTVEAVPTPALIDRHQQLAVPRIVHPWPRSIEAGKDKLPAIFRKLPKRYVLFCGLHAKASRRIN